MTIAFLTPDRLSGLLSPPSNTGINPIFRAKITVTDESIRCYVKPLPDHIICPVQHMPVQNREVISEAIGYVLAKHAGLPVADSAGIILLNREQIPQELHNKLIDPKSGALQEDYFCWFSKDMIHPNLIPRVDESAPPILYQLAIERVIRELSKHPDIHRIVAFDDWLANSDRNLGNLLNGPNGPFLIDHGRIFVYPNWNPGQLGEDQVKCQNKLMSVIDCCLVNWSQILPNKSARLLAYNGFSTMLQSSGETEARAILTEFFEEADIESTIGLLKERLNVHDYKQAAGLLL